MMRLQGRAPDVGLAGAAAAALAPVGRRGGQHGIASRRPRQKEQST